MGKKTSIIIVVAASVFSFFAGIYFANRNIVYGKVDLISGKVDQKVRLKKDIVFQDAKGHEVILKAGTILTWEGGHGFQYYMSIRYILNEGDVFELVDNTTSYDFIQTDTIGNSANNI